MKIQHVPLASFFLLLSFLAVPAEAQWCLDANGNSYWCGDPNDCEGVCSQPDANCTTACQTFGGAWTTCGGGLGNDQDLDGVDDSSDNCPCVENPGQADCDQDGAGDLCDPLNERWVEVYTTPVCDWDGDVFVDGSQVEFYKSKHYVELCSNAECDDTVFDTRYWCGLNSGAGWSGERCCSNWFYPGYCDNLPGCPAETCPFS